MKTTKKIIRARANEKSLSAPTNLKTKPSYETDFFKWVKDQTKYLKKREFSKLDIGNLVEEIESLGKSEKRMLVSYLECLLMHMLKVKFQSSRRTAPWDRTIKVASHKAQRTLSENPSLKPKLKGLIADAYFSARLEAANETGLDETTFPEKCPWTVNEIFPTLEKILLINQEFLCKICI